MAWRVGVNDTQQLAATSCVVVCVEDFLSKIVQLGGLSASP
jgi:hypothetical protein